ncbi:uncharacterized protein MONOS_4787 [Monocercomonoides exilis]|uniref:uncharacterized protein n=1 Tax=Monocercomonoides exilis TaxID=2049356 RepID=UPI003559EC8E|nr:hypothetical protein MONOS_4787 [Monocercomonoides exilis]|eukprot:MONOS_4787.1-p1 / transcript=MONOS_4787.1 / gene=MONOS_4787 / organism=Monocercomonoides_exilis_PA203 / gene_product=unspecified product / transcript_product=unspecified product / location=Mono_scaffold00132:43513-46913(+) / protein_length=882 / sequence_SO=supercontig / SO=protein_coding / is_pseudo=false
MFPSQANPFGASARDRENERLQTFNKEQKIDDRLDESEKHLFSLRSDQRDDFLYKRRKLTHKKSSSDSSSLEAIRVLLDQIQQTDSQLVLQASKELCNYLSNKDTAIITEFQRFNGMSILVNACNSTNSVEIQHNVIQCMMNLAAQENSFTRSVAFAGVPQIIAQILTSSSVLILREDAMMCIGNVASGEDGVKDMLLEGPIPSIAISIVMSTSPFLPDLCDTVQSILSSFPANSSSSTTPSSSSSSSSSSVPSPLTMQQSPFASSTQFLKPMAVKPAPRIDISSIIYHDEKSSTQPSLPTTAYPPPLSARLLSFSLFFISNICKQSDTNLFRPLLGLFVLIILVFHHHNEVWRHIIDAASLSVFLNADDGRLHLSQLPPSFPASLHSSLALSPLDPSPFPFCLYTLFDLLTIINQICENDAQASRYVIQTGIVPLLIQLCSEKDKTLIFKSIKLIGTLFIPLETDEESNAFGNLLVSNNFLPIASNILMGYSGLKKLKTEVGLLLSNLCSCTDESIIDSIIKTGLLSIMLAILSAPSTPSTVAKYLISALHNIACGPEKHKEVMVAEQVAGYMVDALDYKWDVTEELYIVHTLKLLLQTGNNIARQKRLRMEKEMKGGEKGGEGGSGERDVMDADEEELYSSEYSAVKPHVLNANANSNMNVNASGEEFESASSIVAMEMALNPVLKEMEERDRIEQLAQLLGSKNKKVSRMALEVYTDYLMYLEKEMEDDADEDDMEDWTFDGDGDGDGDGIDAEDGGFSEMDGRRESAGNESNASAIDMSAWEKELKQQRKEKMDHRKKCLQQFRSFSSAQDQPQQLPSSQLSSFVSSFSLTNPSANVTQQNLANQPLFPQINTSQPAFPSSQTPFPLAPANPIFPPS